MEILLNKTRLIILKGDITTQDTGAIVNAANSGLLGGGGVDGAIHRAGGPQIMAECREIRARQGGCPTGQAVITGGGRLKAGFVIHTVGPVWSGGHKGEDGLLRSAYHNSLALAWENKIRSISFPSISTGLYHFPVQRAARIALQTVIDFLDGHEFAEIRFVLFDDATLDAYKKALNEIRQEHAGGQRKQNGTM